MAGRRLVFDRGTLVLEGAERDPPVGDGWTWDWRVEAWRCDAARYRDIVRTNPDVGDDVGLPGAARWRRRPATRLRPDQRDAVAAWDRARRRGLVVMPTGAGKTVVALDIVWRCARPTLVVAPILALAHQWCERLQGALGESVGLVGDGQDDIRPLTVTTYQSAALHMDRLGDRFGLVVFDEVHHLPGGYFREAALRCAAPYRLGLTATPEGRDGAPVDYGDLVGPVVYEQALAAARGRHLADYDTVRIAVELAPEEQARHRELGACIRSYIYAGRREDPDFGWEDVVRARRSDPAAAEVLRAWQTRRHFEEGAACKRAALRELLTLHAADRVLVFVGANDVARELSAELLVPALLADTRRAERADILDGFASGEFPVVIANRVLDEGVDVPAVKIAIVLGGTTSTRQARQRLGRVLRRDGDARAVLYELVCRGTRDEARSRARRSCEAYGGTRHRRLPSLIEPAAPLDDRGRETTPCSRETSPSSTTEARDPGQTD